MAKITQEVASLAHFINALGLEIKKSYFGEIPEGFAVPSVYYPVPETINRGYSISGYERESVIYLKVFAKDSMESDYIAQAIIAGIMQAGRNIPIYGEHGDLTLIAFHIYKINSRNLEPGVTQIEISYKTQTAYVGEDGQKALNFYLEWVPEQNNIEEGDDGTEG